MAQDKFCHSLVRIVNVKKCFLDHIKDTNCNLSASIIILFLLYNYIFQSDIDLLVLSRSSNLNN